MRATTAQGRRLRTHKKSNFHRTFRTLRHHAIAVFASMLAHSSKSSIGLRTFIELFTQSLPTTCGEKEVKFEKFED